ncbi:MAG: nucleotidyltransferase family protein [Candidatus Micrarchaeia archaeon]
MRAALLVGGNTKPGAPFNALPKSLLPIAGKPLIEWQMEWLKANGISDIVLLAGPMHETIMRKAKEIGKKEGVSVYGSVEKAPLGTGGALKHAERLLGSGNFVLMNGDVITNLSIGKMHIVNNVATIALVPLRSSYGIVEQKSGIIIGFKEKPVIKEYWINAGVYLASTDIFDYLPTKGDLEKTVFAELSWKGLLKGTKYESVYWRSLDTRNDIENASKDLKKIRITNIH